MKVKLDEFINIIAEYERKILELRYELKNERTKLENSAQKLKDKTNDYLSFKETIEHYQSENREYSQLLNDIKQVLNENGPILTRMVKLHKIIDKTRGL